MSRRQSILFWATAAFLLCGLVLGIWPNTGVRFSGVLFLGLGLLFALYLGLDLLENQKGWRPARIMKRIYLSLAAAGFLLFALLELVIFSGAHTDRELNADCVLVLGAGVNGTEPSPILKSRLDAALSYLQSHPDVPILVSGTQGTGEDISEAEAMRRYLVQKGVENDRICLEEAAGNTEENIRYSKALMEKMGMNPGNITVALVTSEFHLYRARYLAARSGLHVVGIAAKTPDAAARANFYAREAFGLVKDALLTAP